MKSKLLALMLLVGCVGAPPTPDAPPAPTCPATTYRQALYAWDEAYCQRILDCFPQDLGTSGYEGCVAQLHAKHCIGWVPEGSCDWEYPAAKCDALAQCLDVDIPAVACDRDAVIPESCEEAIH